MNKVVAYLATHNAKGSNGKCGSWRMLQLYSSKNVLYLINNLKFQVV